MPTSSQLKRIRVAAFGGGANVPSARFRLRQYIAPLQQVGVEVLEFPLRHGKYPPVSHAARLPWLMAALTEQSLNAARTWRGFDVVFLQREVISTLVTVEPLTRKPRILDVDDAIYMFRGGRTARRLARLADVVICGNSTLAEWFSQHARDIVMLPTPVDTSVLVPRPRSGDGERSLVLGWIGTSGNLVELAAIEDALAKVMREVPNAVLRVVSDRPPLFRTLPTERVEFVPWSAAIEVQAIQGMDIGLMPLRDGPWNRGKCSYKMIQYLACGVPAVVSPVGMNLDVLGHGPAGLAAGTLAEWVDRLLHLSQSPADRARMGAVGRLVAEQHYSVRSLAPVLAGVFRRVADG